MGEPLHNFENVTKACKILLDQDGLSFSKRKITISTSGLVPAIEELGKTVDVSLAISLNASNDEQRSQIMPVNKKWDIAKLMEACRNYPLGPHRRITFEYVMLKDFNDTLDDAARVLKLIRGIPCKVNLIPFNEHSGLSLQTPDRRRRQSLSALPRRSQHSRDGAHFARTRYSRCVRTAAQYFRDGAGDGKASGLEAADSGPDAG